MAKMSFLIVVVAFIVFQHASEATFDEAAGLKNDAQPPATFDGNVLAQPPTTLGDQNVLETDLVEAKGLIEEDLKKKESAIKTLQHEVSLLTKSETMLNELEDASKNGKSLGPFGAKLKKFNRKIKQEPEDMSYIIQSILMDLGLNGGRD